MFRDKIATFEEGHVLQDVRSVIITIFVGGTVKFFSFSRS
jgi:hypothetical protein